MVTEAPKIYIVEDDESIREIVRYALNAAGFAAVGFERGEEFFAAAEKSPPDLLLLDLMLPGGDGLSILKRIRAAQNIKRLPVIILTAKSGEIDKVKGLDLGADDYVTKPFGVMELISRVNAVLRRSMSSDAPPSEISIGELSIDNGRREVRVSGEKINLTFKEYELLHYLALNSGLALSRDKIMETVWGFDFEGESRTLDMHVRSLRHKLGAASSYIETVRNVGYKLSH